MSPAALPRHARPTCLQPGNSVERVDAIVLSGGSAFGLAAADGAMRWLAANGRGFPVGDMRVPIVPAAALFDLTNGGDKSAFPARAASLYAGLGEAACAAAVDGTQAGSVGAGIGATTADLKGGFGAATTTLLEGGTLAAFAAVNPVGRVTLGSTAHFRAAPFEIGGEFGSLGLPAKLPADAADVVTKRSVARTATTLAVVATDLSLTRGQAKRLAIAAHDGIALAIFPAHTPMDGDMVFAVSTGLRPPINDLEQLTELCAAAASDARPGDRCRRLLREVRTRRSAADLARALCARGGPWLS